MPRWIVEPCARCGTEAELLMLGPEWRWQYIVKCTGNATHGTRAYRTGREAVSRWNEAQLKMADGCGLDVVEWVDKMERMPDETDADVYGCVLIWDRLNGVRVTGWRNTQELGREAVTHWAQLPMGPGK